MMKKIILHRRSEEVKTKHPYLNLTLSQKILYIPVDDKTEIRTIKVTNFGDDVRLLRIYN